MPKMLPSACDYFRRSHVSGQFLDSAHSQRHSVRPTRRQANDCPFLVFLVDYFFTFSTLATASGVQDASCRLSPRPRRSLRGNAIPTHPQASPCSPRSNRPRPSRAFVTAVVLDHFPQCRERSHLTFRKVVVYRVSPVPAIEKKGIRTIIYCLSFSRQTSSARYWSLRQCRSATPSCIKRNTSEP